MSRTAPAGQPQLSDYADLVERLVLLIRQSAAVQEARLDAVLDASILAAEQVQNTRIQILETPAEVTGWDIFMDVAWNFLLDTKLVGKLITGTTRWVLGRAVRTNLLFSVLPKSESGKELAFYARNVFAATGRQVVRQGLKELKLPGLNDTDARQLYAGGLQLFLTKGSGAVDDWFNASAKAATRYYKAPKPRHPGPIPVSDSASVAVLSAAQNYARASRLAIRFRHAALESYVRRGAQPAELALIAETVGWDGMDDAEQQGEVLSLVEARDKYRILLEALIWARMYDFREAPPSQNSNPYIFANKDVFEEGPKPELQKYWRGRFQPTADYYVASNGGTVVAGDRTQSWRLRHFFAAINYLITQQSRGAQDFMTALKSMP